MIGFQFIKNFYIRGKKDIIESRGLSRTLGVQGVLKWSYLQSLGSNIRLGVAKVAKSLYQLGMGVLPLRDQCAICLHFCQQKL